MIDEQVASEHVVKGTVLVPDANGETMKLAYTVWIRPTGDDCEIDLPADLDEDHWEDVEATARDAAYEDAYRKVASEAGERIQQLGLEVERLRKRCADLVKENALNHYPAGRYGLLLDRLDGERTDHGNCRVAQRLDELEAALKGGAQ